MLIVGTKEPMKELLTLVPSSLIRTLEQTLAVQAPFINCYLLALTKETLDQAQETWPQRKMRQKSVIK